jgi:hypothetical protein
MTLPFGANINIHDTVRYKDLMKEYSLGPIVASSPRSKVRISSLGPRPYSFIMSLYRGFHVGPERQCHYCMVKFKDRYVF